MVNDSEQPLEGQLDLLDELELVGWIDELPDWGDEDEEEDDLYPYSWDSPEDCE